MTAKNKTPSITIKSKLNFNLKIDRFSFTFLFFFVQKEHLSQDK